MSLAWIPSLTSSCPTGPELDGKDRRKKKRRKKINPTENKHCKLGLLHQDQENSSTFCTQGSSCRSSSCEAFHSESTSRTKARSISCTKHLQDTHGCSWEMIHSYLTKPFWVLPEPTSLAKFNWRGTWTNPAEKKGYCLRVNFKVMLHIDSCHKSTTQVRTEGFPGSRGCCLWCM